MRCIKTLFTLVIIGLSVLTTSAQEPPVLFPEPLSPRIANYNIDVTLDTETRKLDGQEVLIWHNKTSKTITELQFHMYLNAFRNSESTFMKESGGTSRGFKIKKDGWGFTNVDQIKLRYSRDLKQSIQYLHPSDAPKVMDDAYDLTDQIEFIQPDIQEHEHDKTAFRVSLPAPLRPGEFVVIHIGFTAKLPSPPFARTGGKEEFFFVGQWFPKIGVVTDQGWNNHQFHANSEFFADYGVYNVRMTVPKENILGATGIEVSVTDNDDGTATHFYHAEDVHDFAWTTSPEYVEFTSKVQDVDVRVLVQPDHVNQGQRHLDAAKVAIEHFQNWYGDYPFPNLTIVDPRRKAGGAGGMEYPTLITAGTSYGLHKGMHLLEHVIIHEFGHNYWYHLLASNEFEESWMDEGINTYTDIQIVNDAYGPNGDTIDIIGVKLNYIQAMRGVYISGADFDPIMRKAWEFYPGQSYGVNSYMKPGVVLTTLQNYLGWDTMLEVMRQYVKQWRFKHPTSTDFFAVANQVSGQNLDWFFEQAFYTRKQLDYSVAGIFTGEDKDPEGFDFDLSPSDPDSSMTNGEAETDEADSEIASNGDEDAESDSTDDEPPKIYYSGVNVRRLGEFVFPVTLDVTFADGEIIREEWDGKELWKKYRYTRAAKLVSATVDPDNKIILDVNYTNNSQIVEKRSSGVNKLSARWMFWMQFLLDQPDFMNSMAAWINSIN